MIMTIFVEYCHFCALTFMTKNINLWGGNWQGLKLGAPSESLDGVSSGPPGVSFASGATNPAWALTLHTLGLTSCTLRRTSFIAAILEAGQPASHPELLAPPTTSGPR